MARLLYEKGVGSYAFVTAVAGGVFQRKKWRKLKDCRLSNCMISVEMSLKQQTLLRNIRKKSGTSWDYSMILFTKGGQHRVRH
jgi:hypothetical protein